MTRSARTQTNHIKPDWRIPYVHFLDVRQRAFNHAIAFCFCDRFLGFTEMIMASVFDLNEDNGILIRHDEINFTPTREKIRGNPHKAFGL
jgi:hypothetical protein